MRPSPRMAILRPMSSEPPKASESEPPPSASKDLADGLNLMLSAARKALKNVDPNRIEEAGRRALRGLEQLDTKKAADIGRKAAKNLDPRKIEEVAEDAGRELLSVVERVADRVERIASGAIAGAREGARPSDSKSAPPPPAEAKPAADENEKAESTGSEADGKPRVRVGE